MFLYSFLARFHEISDSDAPLFVLFPPVVPFTVLTNLIPNRSSDPDFVVRTAFLFWPYCQVPPHMFCLGFCLPHLDPLLLLCLESFPFSFPSLSEFYLKLAIFSFTSSAICMLSAFFFVRFSLIFRPLLPLF